MALTRYANQPSKTYSGGNKRKLSAAVALLGNPSVIFMVSIVLLPNFMIQLNKKTLDLFVKLDQNYHYGQSVGCFWRLYY